MKSPRGPIEDIRVAVAAWKLRPIRTDGDFYGHCTDLISTAHEEGAELLLLPENHSLELLNLAPELKERNVPAYMAQFADELESWIRRISNSSGLIIVGGSHIRETPAGYKNICPIAEPDGTLTLVEKNRLTTYEKHIWKLVGGTTVATPRASWLGALICYDVEFPEAARALSESGRMVIAAPSFTETRQGFQRVRWCSQARAIENQVFVLHSSLIGDLGREPVPTTFGTSAILTPSAEPFLPSAVLGETEPGEEAVLVRNLSLNDLKNCRQSGDVRNWHDRRPFEWALESKPSENPLS